MGMEQYRIEAHPETDPKSVISGKNYRISVLTEALVRFEYSENGLFEDRPTQKVLNRDFETPDYHVSRDKNGIHIFTGVFAGRPDDPRGGRPFVGAAVALWGQIA